MDDGENQNLANEFTYGIEIEFEGIDLCLVNTKLKEKNLNNWMVESDLSVTEDNIGGEIVSDILKGSQKDYDELNIVCEILKNNGGYVSEFTGGHIHVGAHVLGNDVKNFKRLLKTWLAFENVIYRFAINDSKKLRAYYMSSAMPYSAKLCEKLRQLDRINSFENLYEYIMKIKESEVEYGINLNNLNLVNGVREKKDSCEELSIREFLDIVFKDEAKEQKLTLNNEISYRNTIEFTIFNSSLNSEIWKENIIFLKSLLLYVMSPSFDEVMIESKLKEIKEGYFEMFVQEDAIKLASLIHSSNEQREKLLRRCKVKVNKRGFHLGEER